MKKFSTGEILRAVCKELNLSNKEVAGIISMTPQNVSRLFQAENVNTETIDRLTAGLGINIYAYLAKKWEEVAALDPNITFNEPEREYFRMSPKTDSGAPSSGKPKISILIEIDQDKQDQVMKLLNL